MFRRLLSCLFVAVMLLLAAVGARQLVDTKRFETNILALLPSVYRDADTERLLAAYSRTGSHKVLVVVRSVDAHTAEQGAASVAQSMRDSGLFDDIQERVSHQSLAALEKQFLPYSFQLTEPPHTGDEAEDLRMLLDEARMQAFAPQGVQWLRGAGEDPLLRQPAYMRAVYREGGRYTIRNGYIHVDKPGVSNVIIRSTLAQSGLTSGFAPVTTEFFDRLATPPGVEVIPSGVVFFAEESAGRTRAEISTITSVTLLLVSGVLWWVFRTPRIVIILTIFLAITFLATVAVSDWLWLSATGTLLHLITIGFGSSLIGVSSDYGLHYIVAQRTTQADDTVTPLARVRTGLVLGFITTVVGFLGIAASPFPGLQQLAFFSIAGLLISLLLVCIGLPMFVGRPVFDARIANIARQVQALTSAKSFLIVGILCVVVCVLGLPRLSVRDDIRLLDTPSQRVLQRQREVSRLVGASDRGTTVIVRGRDDEQLLRNEEILRVRLDALIKNGALEQYQAISQFVPSQLSQTRWYAQMKALISSDTRSVDTYLNELHVPLESRQRVELLRRGDPPESLRLASCMASPACDTVRDLYLGRVSSDVASVVVLQGLNRDVSGFLAGIEGVVVVNQGDAISGALERYRSNAMLYTGVVYIFVVLILFLRYGVSHAFRILIPPTLGSLTSLASLGLCGIPINVFSVFAILVLIGLSIDYAIFCAEDDDAAGYTNFAVLLSAITTAISFGLLAYSSTPALQSFGIVLSIGVLVAAVVAPLAQGSVSPRIQRFRLAGLWLCLCLAVAGCGFTALIPKATTRTHFDSDAFRLLCSRESGQRQMSIPGNELRTAALECAPERAIIVVFSSFGMRVQTVRYEASGQVINETSYMDPDPIEPAHLCRLFAG